MPADALGLGLGFIIVFGLLLFACFLLTFVLLVLGGVTVSTSGTVIGLALAAITGVGAYRFAEDMIPVLVAGIVSMAIGVGIGKLLWPGANPPAFVHRSAYRLIVLGVATAAIGAGAGVWIVLVGTLGPSLVPEFVAEHPREAATIVALTCMPILTGGVALNMVRSSEARSAAVAGGGPSN